MFAACAPFALGLPWIVRASVKVNNGPLGDARNKAQQSDIIAPLGGEDMDGRSMARIVGLSMAGIYLLCFVLAAASMA